MGRRGRWARRRWPARPRRAAGALLALALLLAACGPSTTPRAGPVWTPTGYQPASAHPGDWPTFDYDAARGGVNPTETAITPATVGRLHLLWQTTLPQPADSTPILLHDLALPDGTHRDVLYLTTQGGTLAALDAATGAMLWTRANPGPKLTNSSPVADPARDFVYSYGLDGRVHKYDATTGAETRGGGWPVTVTRMTQTEKQGTSLNVANGYLYVGVGGYVGDAPPYQGHVVAIALPDATVHVFNTLCSDQTAVLGPGRCPDDRAAVWARAGVTVDPATGYLWLATGNGPFNADRGGHDWGDTVLELAAGATRVVDTYTPTNQQMLEATDADLGSTAPALLPAIPGARWSYLAVQGGKDDRLRLLDRQNLAGPAAPGHLGGELQSIATPGGCPMLTQPAVWREPGGGAIWLFATDSCATAAYQAVTSAAGATTLKQVWSIDQAATSPVVAGGVLFAATGGKLFALDPHTGRQLWSSADAGAGGSIGAIHWESPIVIGGRVYCPDQDGRVTAYGL